nr:transmembrane protein 53 [Quercus suber]
MASSNVPGFQSLAKDISLWRPAPNTAQSSTTQSVSLIIFCSWMGAAPKHIAKYTEAYKQLFPKAEILLLQSSLSTVLHGGVDMTAACSVIHSHLPLTQGKQNLTEAASSSKILWHAFSNGGAMNTVNLIRQLQDQKSSQKLPASAATLILDCNPGKPNLSATLRAVMLQLPRLPKVLRLVVKALVTAIASLYMIVYFLLQWVYPLTQARRDLNDPNRFPHEAARLYLYSKADVLVPWREISEHVLDARKSGYHAVSEEVFENAQHCFLLAEDAERYWGAVRKVIGS